MKAIAIDRFGEQPRLREVPLPDPGSGEVDVRLVSASANPLDAAVAGGFLAGLGEYRFPLVPGFDGAGVVRRVGDDVTTLAVGDRVFGQFWSQPMQFGTYAEATIAQAEPAFGALTRMPDDVGFDEAAASPTAGMTAAGAIEHCGATAGDTVLILGAAGGVGTFAVQYASRHRLVLIAPARDELAGPLHELGVSTVIPREPAGLRAALAALDSPIAAVLDFAGHPETTATAATALRIGGVLLSTANGIPDAVRGDRRIHAVDYVVDRKPERLARLAGHLADGTVVPVIGDRLDLADVVGAPTQRPVGLRGKTVIHVASPVLE